MLDPETLHKPTVEAVVRWLRDVGAQRLPEDMPLDQYVGALSTQQWAKRFADAIERGEPWR